MIAQLKSTDQVETSTEVTEFEYNCHLLKGFTLALLHISLYHPKIIAKIKYYERALWVHDIETLSEDEEFYLRNTLDEFLTDHCFVCDVVGYANGHQPERIIICSL